MGPRLSVRGRDSAVLLHLVVGSNGLTALDDNGTVIWRGPESRKSRHSATARTRQRPAGRPAVGIAARQETRQGSHDATSDILAAELTAVGETFEQLSADQRRVS
jgi:hypothetical protein